MKLHRWLSISAVTLFTACAFEPAELGPEGYDDPGELSASDAAGGAAGDSHEDDAAAGDGLADDSLSAPLAENPDDATVALMRSGSDYSTYFIQGTGVDSDTGASQAIDDTFYLIEDLSQVDAVPLPAKVKNEIKAATVGYGSENNDVIVINKREAEAYAAGNYGVCAGKDKIIKRSFSKGGNWSKDLTPEKFSGKLKLGAKIDNKTDLEVAMKTYCKVWVRFNKAKLTNVFSADLSAEAVGKASASFDKSIKVTEPVLYNKLVMVGWVPVWIKISLPISVGVDVGAKAELALKATYKATSSHTFSCVRGDGCSHTKSGSKSFNIDGAPNAGNHNARANVKPYLEVVAKLSIYKGAAWGQAGLRAGVRGDYWSYSGATCGDANNDGKNESVQARTLDTYVDLDFVAKAGFFKKKAADYKGNIGSWYVGFYKLPGAQTALAPIFYEYAYLDAGESHASMRGKMRPCWPYTNTLNSQITWANGSKHNFTMKPSDAPFLKSHASDGTVTLKVLTDTKGREINASRNAQYSGF